MRRSATAEAVGTAGGSRPPVDGFVSYARRDAAAVAAVVNAIVRLGRSMWLDAEDIAPGALWREELRRAIEDAAAVVCFVSPNWSRSAECRAEVQLAISLGKRLVPVVLAPVAVDELPGELRAVQWIDTAASGDVGRVAAAVIAAIDVDPDRVRDHTYWLGQALRWDAAGRHRSQLARGRGLRAAEAWLQRAGRDPEPTPLHIAFVTASRRAERRRNRLQLAIAVVGVLIASSLAAVALQQRNTAVRERDTARSRALAVASSEQLARDPELALLLARAGWQSAHTSEALSALRAAVHQSLVRTTVRTGTGAVDAATDTGRVVVSAGRSGALTSWNAVTGRRLDRRMLPAAPRQVAADRHADAGVVVTADARAVRFSVDAAGRFTVGPATAGVTDAAISGDGRATVVGLADGAVRRSVDGAPATRVLGVGSTERPASVAVSDGAAVVAVGTAGRDYRDQLPVPGVVEGRVWVHDARGTRLLHRHLTPVHLLATDDAGRYVLSVADDGSGVVQRVDTGRVVLRIASAFRAALDPTGRYAVISTLEGATELGSTATGRWTALAGRSEPLSDLRFGADGAVVVGAAAAGSGHAWATSDGRLLASFLGSSGPMSAIAVTPDGRQVVTGHENGDLHTWALPGGPVRVLLGDPDQNGTTGIGVNSTSVAPDGTILTAADDALVQTWSHAGRPACLAGGQSLSRGHCPLTVGVANRVTHLGLWELAVFSPDGRQVAVLASDGSVWIFAAAKVPLLVAHTAGDGADARPANLAYSPDGRLLLAQRGARPPRLLDARTGRVVALVRTPRSDFYSCAWLPDDRVVVADAAGHVDVYGPRGQHLRRIATITGAIAAVAATADGRRVAVASGTHVDLLDAASGRTVLVFDGHTADVDALDFSADGTYLLSGGADGTARLWDTATATTLSILSAPGSQIQAVTFDDRSRTVIAAGRSSAVYLDTCDVCVASDELARLAAVRSTRPLTDAERRQYGVGSLLP